MTKANDKNAMIYKTLHRKLKIQQHDPTKTRVNSCSPEGQVSPAPLMANDTQPEKRILTGIRA